VHLDFSEQARRFICAVSGHDDFVCIEGRRIFVECRHCGRRSSGLHLPLAKNSSALQRQRGTSAGAATPRTVHNEPVTTASGAVVAVNAIAHATPLADIR
jgi:hypothetical protein